MNGTSPDNTSLIIAGQLKRARLVIFASRFLAGLFRWLGVNLALWAILIAGDMLLDFPVELRLPMIISGMAVGVFTLFKWLIKPSLVFYDLDRTALELEKRFGIPRNLLINSFQLSRKQLSREEQELARETIRRGLSKTTGIKYNELWQFPLLLKGAGTALAIIVLWLAAGFMLTDHITYALNRIYSPFADLPPPGSVVLTVIPDMDVTVHEGDSHKVTLKVEPRGNRQTADPENTPPRIVITDAPHVGVTQGDNERGIYMTPADTKHGAPETLNGTRFFFHELRDLRRLKAFRIFHDSGGTYTRSYQVRVEKTPEIISSEFRLTPPAYTGLSQTDMPGPPQSAIGLPDSRLIVEIHLDTPVKNLFWKAHEETIAFTGDDGRHWTCETTIKEAGAYEIFSMPDNRQRNMPIAAGSLLLERDLVPHVAFAVEHLNREAWPGETVDLDIIAEDDYGIADVVLNVVPAHIVESEKTVIADWFFEGPPGERRPETIRVSHCLNPGDFTPGNDYLFTAVAGDFHPDRQKGSSRPLLIKIKNIDALPESYKASSALEALQQAIVTQQRALSDIRTVADYMDSVLGRGEEGERQEFTFHHYRQQIETRQKHVHDLLRIVSERASEPEKEYADAVEKTRAQMVQPLVEDIQALSGNTELWFAGQNPTVESNQAKTRFKPETTRFLGLRFSSGQGKTTIAELDFIDTEGQVVPPPYLEQYHFSSIYREWDGPVGFVDSDATELRNITETAIENEMKGGQGPLLDLRGMVEGAPDRNVVLYAARRIHCDKARRIVLWAGSSDSLRVWINGELAINRLARRAPAPNQEQVILSLRQGANLLLAEVSAADQYPVLAMRFAEPDGTQLALLPDGRLVRAILPKIAYAGCAPANAVNAVDRNNRTSWQTDGNRSCLLIVDIGQSNKISGLLIHPPEKSKQKTGFKYNLYTAEELLIYDKLPPVVDNIANRQTEIIDRLAAIRTAWLEREDDSVEPEKDKETPALPPTATVAELRELVAELLDTSADSIELSAQRKSVLELYGEDFTENTTARLQNIKHNEKRLAQYLRDVVQDMSALGNLDLPDATQAANMQELVKKSELLADIAKEKAEKPITHISDSLDTAEIELHEELKKQSEVAFGDTSRLQDEQELGENMKTPLPMAELPQTLGDLVGEMEEDLLEFEDEAQTVGSMLKALDADGPIGPGRMSSTSAEGKTGNEPPDAARELEGRSGFGRTGRASGEGVANVAEDLPQDKRAAPPRDTGTSLEEGMVEDRSTEAVAASTGLGKETDDTERFGMGGSQLPAGVLARMRKTAGDQKDLRETVGNMILELRRHNLPSVKLNRAARAMDMTATAAEDGEHQEFLRAYVESMDHLYQAEEDIGRSIGIQYIQEHQQTIDSKTSPATATDVPEAYKDIVSEYFKALAENGEETGENEKTQ